MANILPIFKNVQVNAQSIKDEVTRAVINNLIKAVASAFQHSNADVNLTVAPLNSPAFTGIPTAPTNASAVDATTQLATDAFVQNATAAYFGTNFPTNFASSLALYLAPIDNSAAVSDITLSVGQKAYINFTNASTIPLHIACADNQVYRLTYTAAVVLQNATAVMYLDPNNTAYGSVFNFRQMFAQGATVGGSAAGSASHFYLGAGGGVEFELESTIWTSTLFKHAISKAGGSTATASYVGAMAAEWPDTTTLWTSLGTLNMGATISAGQVMIERVI